MRMRRISLSVILMIHFIIRKVVNGGAKTDISAILM